MSKFQSKKTITLEIQELEAWTVIGIHNWEQSRQQKLLIDLRMELAQSNPTSLAESVDYHEIQKSILELVASRKWELVEDVLRELDEHISKLENVKSHTLSIAKPQATPWAKTVKLHLG